MINIKCWATEYCKSHDKEHICNKFCIGFNQLKYLYKSSNMPVRYQGLYDLQLIGEDLDVYNFLVSFKQNIVKNVQAGESLFFGSEHKGNGKTSWACILMNQYFKKIALKNNLRCRGIFINVPEFLNNLKDDFSRDDKEHEETKYNIKVADMVIWDDIGAEKESTWVKETLYNYINHRYSNNLFQLYTSNIPVPLLRDRLGERILSRIRGQCQSLRFDEKDKRGVEV